MSEAYKNPNFLISDFAKLETPSQLHLFFEALSQFEMHHNRVPIPWNEEDAVIFVECCKAVNKDVDGTAAHVEQVDESLAKIFSFISAGNCCPIQVEFSSFLSPF